MHRECNQCSVTTYHYGELFLFSQVDHINAVVLHVLQTAVEVPPGVFSLSPVS